MAEALIAVDKPDEALQGIARRPSRPIQTSAGADADGRNLSADRQEERGARIGCAAPLRNRLKTSAPVWPWAKWCLDEGRLEKSAAEFAAAEKIDPKSIEVKLGLGTVARYQHDYAKARRNFEAVLEQAPGNFSASNQLALVMADQADQASCGRRSRLPPRICGAHRRMPRPNRRSVGLTTSSESWTKPSATSALPRPAAS